MPYVKTNNRNKWQKQPRKVVRSKLRAGAGFQQPEK